MQQDHDYLRNLEGFEDWPLATDGDTGHLKESLYAYLKQMQELQEKIFYLPTKKP
jgi:hypothetical protein